MSQDNRINRENFKQSRLTQKKKSLKFSHNLKQIPPKKTIPERIKSNDEYRRAQRSSSR
jgi:hypothetical protein